jgi:hypothetical protein
VYVKRGVRRYRERRIFYLKNIQLPSVTGLPLSTV